MGVREWVEEKVDRVKERVSRPIRDYSDRRERDVDDRASREFIERRKYIKRKRESGEISEKLANKWIARAHEKRERTSVPFSRRVGRTAARAIVGAADRAYNPGGRPTRDVWGVQGFTEKPRYAQRISSGATRSYSMLYGSQRSFKTAKAQFKSQRSPQQFGNFLVTGRHSGTSRASGWGILYGKRAKTSMWGVEKPERTSRGGRRGSRRGRDSGAGGWVGLL